MSNLLFKGVYSGFFTAPADAEYTVEHGHTVVSWGSGDDRVVATLTERGVVRTSRHLGGWRTELIREEQVYD